MIGLSRWCSSGNSCELSEWFRSMPMVFPSKWRQHKFCFLPKHIFLDFSFLALSITWFTSHFLQYRSGAEGSVWRPFNEGASNAMVAKWSSFSFPRFSASSTNFTANFSASKMFICPTKVSMSCSHAMETSVGKWEEDQNEKMKDKTKHRLRTRSYFPRLYKLRIALSILYFRIGNLSSFSGLTIDITEIIGWSTFNTMKLN